MTMGEQDYTHNIRFQHRKQQHSENRKTKAIRSNYRQIFELLQTHIRDLKKRKQTDWCSDETKETNPGGSKAANPQSRYTATPDLL